MIIFASWFFYHVCNELNGEWSEGLGVGNPCLSAIRKVFSQKKTNSETQWLDRQESSMAIQKMQAFRGANFELRNVQISQKLLGSTFFWGGIWWNKDTTWYNHTGVSENRLNPCTQWFCWSLSLLNGYNWGYTPFSDIQPYRSQQLPPSFPRENVQQLHWDRADTTHFRHCSGRSEPPSGGWLGLIKSSPKMPRKQNRKKFRAYLVGGWATPLKNMKVSCDDYSQYMEK